MDDYTRKMMRIAVAQTCLNVGWSTIQTSPLEILTDLLSNYILGLCKRANNYAFLFNQTEPNLDHLALAFQDMGVSIPELEEFVNYFDISGCPEVPQYPIQKDSNLNFLKPGSREVVTRPVHIHEHLPPMYPHLEEQETATVKTEGTPPPEHSAGASSSGGEPVVVSPNTGGLKRRSDNPSESFAMRRARALAEEETRTLREISSVMMTTSGFLSHAREGKLPEVRTIPIVDSEPEEEVPAPPPPPPPPPPPELKPEPQLPPPEVVKPEKKKKKKSHGEVIKKEKEKPSKDDVLTALQHLLPSKAVSIHPIPPDDSQIKKLATQKETSKLKVLKPGATKTIAVMPDSFHSTPKPEKKHKPKRPNSPAAAILTQSPIIPPKLKIPKLEKNPIKERINDELPIDPFADIKLTAEPDKQKLNIFKKISKVKDDHDDIKMEVDDFVPTKSIKDPPIHDVVKKCPATTSVAIDVMKEDKEVEASMDIENLHSPTAFGTGVFGDELMPGTPTTPRTPDIPKIATDSKKKNREKHKEKKDRDKFNVATSPVSSRICDIDNMKPKTPEVIVDTVDEGLPPFPFLSYPTGPALIPPNLASNPLIPQMNLMPFGPRLLPPPVSLIPSQLKDMLPSVPLPTSSPALTITMTPSPATSSNVSTPATTPLSKKKDKKGKKNKDKIKKKKDKKEKIKSKEKSEKKKLKLQKKQKLQEKLKMKKEKKYKKKENQIQEEKRGDSPSVPKITFKLGPEPQREISPSPKITFKPLIKKEDDASVEISKKHSSDVSAGTTSKHHKSSSKSAKASSSSNSHSEGRSHHQKGGDSMGGTSKTTGHHQVSSKQPVAPVMKEEPVEIAESNQLWICPACGRPDDGSPMIACDACDMWYHYVCVGIQDAPESDWFCQGCISKRPDLVDKKKKHKKKK